MIFPMKDMRAYQEGDGNYDPGKQIISKQFTFTSRQIEYTVEGVYITSIASKRSQRSSILF